MAQLPTSLAIALWLIGALWIVGLAAYYFDAPGEIVWLALLVEVATGLTELAMHKRKNR